MELNQDQKEELRKFSTDSKIYSNRIRRKDRTPTKFWAVGKAPTVTPRFGIQFRKYGTTDWYIYKISFEDS